MSIHQWKGLYTLGRFLFVLLISSYAIGCSDAASKASNKQPVLSVLDIFPADGAKSISTNMATTAVSIKSWMRRAVLRELACVVQAG